MHDFISCLDIKYCAISETATAVFPTEITEAILRTNRCCTTIIGSYLLLIDRLL
jgi:hypothetical protein